MFYLSKRSLRNLKGVDDRLVEVVHLAIELTEIDFGVIEGLRSLAKQRQYVKAGVSWTMNSKHLSGDAVDLMAYMGRRACWEIDVYDEIAAAVREAAESVGVGIRWGGAWTVPNICEWDGTMQDASNSYIDLRRSQNRRPRLDGPHFEIADEDMDS